MSRIFASLSVVVIGALILCAIHGSRAGDYNRAWQLASRAHEGNKADRTAKAEPPVGDAGLAETASQFRASQASHRLHTLAGLLVSLLAILVNSLSTTYFIGTGRWCREVSDAYELGPDAVARSKQLKRQSLPLACAGVALALGIAATGAASDPGTLMQGTAAWVKPHLWSSILGTTLMALMLAVQWRLMRSNQLLIDQIMQEVRQLREQRGLPV